MSWVKPEKQEQPHPLAARYGHRAESLTPIPLNDLPSHVGWLEESLMPMSATRQRDTSDVLREFEAEKWGALLQELDCPTGWTLEALEDLLWSPDEVRPVALGGEYFLASPPAALDFLAELTVKSLGDLDIKFRTMVEFGVGYGAFSVRLAERLLSPLAVIHGYDISRNALRLFGGLCEAQHQAALGLPWDLADEASWPKELPPNALVVTSSTLMYARRSLSPFFRYLADASPAAIVTAEPIWEDLGGDLVGILGRRYMRKNGYYESILTDIQQEAVHNCSNLRLACHIPRLAGTNPLLPISLHIWIPGN